MKIINLGVADGLPPVDWEEIVKKVEARSSPALDAHNTRTTWLATVNEDGSPHVTAVGAIWLDGTFWFQTGDTRKGRAAQHNTGRQAEMRTELKETVVAFLAGLDVPNEPQPLTDEEAEAPVLLADLATRCRSAIERNPRDREVELVPQPEVASRLLAVLTQLVRGLSTMGIDREEIGHLVVKHHHLR